MNAQPITCPAVLMRDCHNAIQQLERNLIDQQKTDGSWRDYPDIEVGTSLSWTTAYVAFALSCSFATRRVSQSVFRAAQVLRRKKQTTGWGYNDLSACDSDSTAWAVRLLIKLDALDYQDAIRLLAPYVDEHGRVSTFPDPSHFKSWSTPNDEVAPVLALALLETNEAEDLVDRIVTHQVAQETSLLPFWWETPDYALSWNLQLRERLALPLSGPLSALLDNRLCNAKSESIFSASLLALASPARLLQHRPQLFREIVHQVLDQNWSPDAVLLVPDQANADQYSRHVDEGLMTGATLIMALKKMLKICHF